MIRYKVEYKDHFPYTGKLHTCIYDDYREAIKHYIALKNNLTTISATIQKVLWNPVINGYTDMIELIGSYS